MTKVFQEGGGSVVTFKKVKRKFIYSSKWILLEFKNLCNPKFFVPRSLDVQRVCNF